MFNLGSEARETLLDQAAIGRLHRRNFLATPDGAGPIVGPSPTRHAHRRIR